MFMCFSFCPSSPTLSLRPLEEPDCFSASHQVFSIDVVFPPRFFFFEDKQFQPSLVGQICSPLMISVVLHWTYCQHVHACLVNGSPALDTALGCAGQNGRTTSLNLLAALSCAAWDLLAVSAAETCCWLVFSLLSVCESFSVRLLSPPAWAGAQSGSSLVQGSAFCAAERHEIPISTFLQPVKVPLNGRGVISSFCIIWNFAEEALSLHLGHL